MVVLMAVMCKIFVLINICMCILQYYLDKLKILKNIYELFSRKWAKCMEINKFIIFIYE